MKSPAGFALGAALLACAAGPLAAQGGGVAILGYGAHYSPLNSLASGTGDEFRPGFAVGGGLGWLLGPHVALRGYVTRVSTKYRGPTLQLADSSFTRLFYGGDLQLGWPSDVGLAPYLFAGAGKVAINPAEDSLPSFTRFVVRGGTGINFVIEGAGITPFVEIALARYKFDQFGFDKTQLDFSVSVGLAFPIRY